MSESSRYESEARLYIRYVVDETPAQAPGAPSSTSPASVKFTPMVTFEPAFADVGVAGSSAKVTSASVIETAAEFPASKTPVALPVRRIAGKLEPVLVQAIARTRYGPPPGTPTFNVTDAAPGLKTCVAASFFVNPPPSITTAARLAAPGRFDTLMMRLLPGVTAIWQSEAPA